MKKIIISLLLVVAGSLAAADTQTYYGPSTTGGTLSTYSGGVYGIDRNSNKIYMSPNTGRGAALYLSTSATERANAICYDLLGNWHKYTAVLGTGAAWGSNSGLWGFGDSAFALLSASGTYPWRIAKFRQDTLITLAVNSSAYDTVDTQNKQASSNGRPGVVSFTVGGVNRLLVVNRTDSGTTDTIYTFRTAGALADSSTWSKISEFLSPTLGTGPKYPLTGITGFNGAILSQDLTANGTAYLTADSGAALVSTAGYTFNGFTPNINGIDLLPIHDSILVQARQINTTDGTDSLIIKRWKVRRISGPKDTLIAVDSTKIADASEIVNGHWSLPRLAQVGLDTLYLIFSKDADTTFVCYRSFNGGASWSSYGTLFSARSGPARTGVNSDTLIAWSLQVSPQGASISGSHYLMFIYVDSLLTGSDSISAVLAKFDYATTAPQLLSIQVDTCHSDFSGENDSIRVIIHTPATAADSFVYCHSFLTFVDSANGTRQAFVYNADSWDTFYYVVTAGAEPRSEKVSAWTKVGTIYSTRDTASRYFDQPCTNSLLFIDSGGNFVTVENDFVGTPDSAVYWMGLTTNFYGAIRIGLSTGTAPDTLIATSLGASTTYYIWCILWRDGMNRDQDYIATKTTAGSATSGKTNIMGDYLKGTDDQWEP